MSIHQDIVVPTTWWLFAMLAALCAATGHHHSHEHHQCVHGEVPLAVKPTIGATQRRRRADALSNATTWAPIRITFLDNNLFNASKFCNSSGDVIPDFRGGTMLCRDVDVLTDAKRNILRNIALPAAIKIISERLSVQPTEGNLKVAGTQTCGSQLEIPASHTSSGAGLPSTDFAVYVSAGPVASNSTLAFASFCQLEPGTQRPVVGYANFNPRSIAWNFDAVPGSEESKANQRYIKTAVHELCHALGFSSSFFPLLQPPNGSTSAVLTTTVRGKPGTTTLRSPSVVEAARAYHNCSTIDGVEIEDEGGSGTAGNHWERRNERDELMAGVVGLSAFSNFTLAFFHDLGFYKANFSAAEPMLWGKNRSCTFLTSPCNTTAGGLNTEFCNPVTQTALMCTPDRSAIGGCQQVMYTSALPSYQQYYGHPNISGVTPLMDHCASVSEYSNFVCTDLRNPLNGDASSDSRSGFVFSPSSRCVDTTNNFASGGLVLGLAARCLQVRCPGGTRLQVAVKSFWVDCPLDGSSKVMAPPAQSGFAGTFTCPPAKEICIDPLLFVEETTTTTTTMAPVTTTSTTTTTTTQVPPSTSTPTTALVTNAPVMTTTTTLSPPPSTTQGPKSPFSLFRFNFSCAPIEKFREAYRQTTWGNMTDAAGEDISLALATPRTSLNVIGMTVLPASAKLVVLVALVDDSVSAAAQKEKLIALNQTLSTSIVAGALATLFRKSLNSQDFQTSYRGVCWPSYSTPTSVASDPSAVGILTLTGSANFSALTASTTAASQAKEALRIDVSNALGTQSSFVLITKLELTAMGTALRVLYQIALPQGLLLDHPIVEWSTEAEVVVGSQSASMAQTLAVYGSLVGNASSSGTIAMLSFTVAAPPPPSTAAPTTTTPAPPESLTGVYSENCIMAKFNYCFFVEIGVLVLIVIMIIVFVCRCYRKSKQRKAIEERLRREADAKAREHIQQAKQRKLQNHLAQQIHHHQGILNQPNPYMIDLNSNPFGQPPVPHQQHGSPPQRTLPPPPPQQQSMYGHVPPQPQIPGRLHTFQQQQLAPQTLAKHGGTGPRHHPHRNRDDDLDDIL